MTATIKIWWHDGATKDVRYNELPVVNEPELGFESVTVSLTAGSTGPAPEDAVVALVESDGNFRDLGRRPGGITDADPVGSKPLPATEFGTNSIGVAKNCTISFLEV